MKKPEPKCPYCGETMKIHADEFYGGSFAIGYAYCPACGSYGPTVKATTDEAVKRIHDDVKAAALRRPLQKPLTLRELRELLELTDATDEEAIIYCESKEDPRTYAHILYNGRIIDFEAKAVNVRLLVYKHYGKIWRAWATRPTDEERAAAPWEE